MFNTSPLLIQGRVTSFATAPWSCRSNAVAADGAGKCGAVAAQSRWCARLHRRLAALLAGAGVVFLTVGPLRAQVGTNWTGLNPFVTTNSATATNKPSPAGGDGWEQPGTNGVPVKAGGKIWLAFLNIEAPLTKFFRIEFYAGTHAEAENLRLLDGGGFRDNGSAVGGTQKKGGPNSLNGEPRPGFVYQEFTFDPQPAWERISFINQNNHDIELKNIQAWSVCARARPIFNKLTSSNTLFGADGPPGVMRTNQRIREVWVFPKTRPLDPGVQPQFVAPPATGFWNFQFVQVDPYGGTRPLGIKWLTAGPGLATDQAVDFSFAMQGSQADWSYTMYAFDGTMGKYQEYNLDFLPSLTISGDGNGVALQFDSVAQMNHALETSLDLSNWQPFQSLPGNGQPVTIPCALTNTAQYFRFQVP